MFNVGGMLTGDKIRKEIKKGNISISNYDPNRINPNSYNLTLNPQILVYKRGFRTSETSCIGLNSIDINAVIDATCIKFDKINSEVERLKELVLKNFEETKKKIAKKTFKPEAKQPEDLMILHEESKTSQQIQEEKKEPDNTEGEQLHANSYDVDDLSSKFGELVVCISNVSDSLTNTFAVTEKKFFEAIRNIDGSLSDVKEEIHKRISALTRNINENSKRIKTNLEQIKDKLYIADMEHDMYESNFNRLIKIISEIQKIQCIKDSVLDPLDSAKQNETIEFTIPEEGIVLQPGVLYIGRTNEITATDKYIPMINGRSSGGRLGISIHICAGFGDIGFDGTWTLEITCVEPVRIYPNTEVAQVCFFKPCGKVKDLYRGRYQGQVDATPSRFHLKKENKNE